MDELKDHAIKAGVTEDEFNEFTAYAGGFYNNMGNYNSFGALKFVPELKEESFHKILKSNPLYQKQEIYKKLVDETYTEISKDVYAFTKPYKQLGFPDDGGITAYFGRNMKKEDLNLVKEFLDFEEIDVLNTRAFKDDNGKITITVGSIDSSKSKYNVKFKNHNFDIAYGEFAPYLKELNMYLGKAIKYADNENQVNMLKNYMKHFKSGSIPEHKDSQRDWIKDKAPAVETNIGWIENYVDPENKRAIFEGWVAVVDKERSQKF